MEWIKLKDRKPSSEIDGEKVLVYRIPSESQESNAISILDTRMTKFCNEDETWWISLPDKPNVL